MSESLDFLSLPGMRAALAARDITKVYKLLKDAGVAQRTIAGATGQSQSEVSEILNGRQVMGYDVLVRICEGLGISRGAMGLAYDGVEEETAPAPSEEVDEEMKRRALMAVGSVALFGVPVLGEVLEIPAKPATPTPLPSSLVAGDVAAIRSMTSGFRDVARAYGGCAEPITKVANRSRVLMSVPASEEVHLQLSSALAELHTLAGWTCVDSGYHDQARAHFARAMELGARDSREMASAFRHAGIQMVDAGAFNDGLKAFQLGLMSATDRETTAWMYGETAFPLTALGEREAALTAISRAREQKLTDPFDAADMDYLTSCVYGQLGRLDTAEALAASSMRRWASLGAHRDAVEGAIALASLHVRAGELDSVALAQQAISQVSELRSVRARMKLRNLVAALETRPSRADFTELARRARQVAGVQV